MLTIIVSCSDVKQAVFLGIWLSISCFLQARIANCSCTNHQHLTHTSAVNTLHTH